MNNFEYMQPKSLKSASKYLEKNPKALFFAGGTDVLGLMKDSIINPETLVNLKSIDNLSYVKYDSEHGLKIGALTKLNDIAENDIVQNHYPALFQAIKQLATPQLRNQGTIGGNICQRPRCFYFRGDYNCIRKGGNECFALSGNNKYHCIIGGDPCYIVHPSDTAVVLVAMDAEFLISGPKKERTVKASEFFILPQDDETKENILAGGEILSEIIIPPQSGNVSAKYIKVKERGTWDFMLVSIAGIFNTDGKKIVEGKIAFGGVAPIPWMDSNVNKYLKGMSINDENISKLSQLSFARAEVLDMNSYKLVLARNMIKKLLYESFEQI